MDRVVAYIRVSTDKKEQEGSLEHQLQMAQEEIRQHKGWKFAGYYADKGTSGTKLTRRGYDITKDGKRQHIKGFTEMLEDAGLQALRDDNGRLTDKYNKAGESSFDRIWTSNTSRFARNVAADAIIKELGKNHVYIEFADINKTTEKSEDCEYIHLFMSMAESQSRDTSRKVSKGMAAAAKQGILHVNTSIYGYDYQPKTRTEPGRLIVNEAQAEVVRMIYNWYTEERIGTEQICRRLNEKGILSARGKSKWSSTAVNGILRNKKYAGYIDGLKYNKGKVFTDGKLKRVPIEERKELEIYSPELVPPIISLEQYEAAQERRSENTLVKGGTGKYNGITPFMGKLVCGVCGASLVSAGVTRHKDGTIKRYYTCSRRYRYEAGHKCTANTSITQEALEKRLTAKGYLKSCKEDLSSLQALLDALKSRLQKQVDAEHDKQAKAVRDRIKANGEAKKRILDLMETVDDEELKERYAKLSKQGKDLAAELETVTAANSVYRAAIEKSEEFKKGLEQEGKALKKADPKCYDLETVLRAIDYIEVNEDGLEIYFKKRQEMWSFISTWQKKLRLLESSEH